MEDICGISGNFKLALQVSMETHCISSLRSLAGSATLPHACGICSTQSLADESTNKHMLFRDKSVNSPTQEPGSATDEESYTEPEVIIKQEPLEMLDYDEHETDRNTSTTDAENQQFDAPDDDHQMDSTTAGKQPLLIPGVEEPYGCGICRESFQNPSILRHHFIRHRGKKSYMCTVCSKLFGKLQNLRQHLVIHSGEKQFKCDKCPSEYFRSTELVRHKKIHTGEQSYTCQICMKCFTWSNSLKRHLRVHSGERPYSCAYCGKTFKDCGHLRTHKLMHTGGKPYRCDACAQRFGLKKLLLRHKCPGPVAETSTGSKMASTDTVLDSSTSETPDFDKTPVETQTSGTVSTSGSVMASVDSIIESATSGM